MAHTPGPWRLHPTTGVIVVNGSTVYSVKDLTTENEMGLAGDASLDDKRLMAAAPELLAALEDAKSELIHLYERLHPSDESDNETTDVIDRVIALIDKARGEDE